MTINEIIEQMTEDARRAVEYAQSRLKEAPEGTLRIRNKDGNLRYLQRMTNADTNGKYLGKDSEGTIRGLEEKAYCIELEKVAAKEVQTLEKIRKLIAELPDYGAVFLSIPQEKRHLIEPFEAPIRRLNDREVKDLLRVCGPKKFVKPDKCYVTRGGDRVRSKSELIIADKLNEQGIPYYYEMPKLLYDERVGYFTWHPDFKVINRRTGQQYYWEHFGMLDSEDYCADSQVKLEIYANNGYFIGKNLIITTESSKHMLNTAYLDKVIEEFLK